MGFASDKVLRSGSRTKADLAAVASFPPEIYCFPALVEVTAALRPAQDHQTLI
jgi:hypothetical protein